MPQSRQLAAIMFTDIVGYTALMGNDEQKALDILNRNRALHKPVIEKNHGRWIKELGDGVMASFNTVSDAVNSAIQILHGAETANEFQLRIGIHLGEVIFEDNDVFGDGVNIAARIQSAASPGTIYVSESVYNNISNKQGIKATFVKQETLKNVREPVRMYEIHGSNSKKPVPTATKTQPTKSTEKSIAVLPFVNMSNDPEQDYFCDGISEEIINALTQLDKLRVIARTSAFAFKGKNIDVREIGKSLDAMTLLEGSVRKSGKRVRITTQLVKASDGSHIWSDRYDRDLEDIFSIQEDIASNVATSLKGYLTSEEKEVIRPYGTVIAAYEYFLKGRQFLHKLVLDDAKVMFEKAIEVDSEYAPAYAGLADLHTWLFEWYGAKQLDLEAADKYSMKALSLAPQLAESHSSRGNVLTLSKHYQEAEDEFLEAIRLNSNSYDAYYYYARSSFSRGQIRKSADLFLKASETRKEDFQSLLLLSQSLRILGDPKATEYGARGVINARKQLELDPEDRRALSLGAGYLYDLGQKEEAFKWIDKAVALYPDDSGVLVNAGCLYSKNGDKEKALDILETVFCKGFGKKDWIENDTDYDNLRNEPRFIAMLNRLT